MKVFNKENCFRALCLLQEKSSRIVPYPSVEMCIRDRNYNGEETGDAVYYQPAGQLENQEWVTPDKTNMYDNKNLLGSIYCNGKLLQKVEKGTYQDGTEGPIIIKDVYKRQHSSSGVLACWLKPSTRNT